MPKAYSRGLRDRVIETVEPDASRREAAERFEATVASASKVVAAGAQREERYA
jgi:hypothetical protein